MITILFTTVLVFILSSIVFYTILYGISPMPSSSKAKAVILSAIPPVGHGTIYELGSGWGTLAFPLARRYPQFKVIGYEVSPIPYYYSKKLLEILPQLNLQFLRKDFMKEPLEEATVIVCYLYPEAMRKLKEKFDAELIPGTVIISNTFAIPGWKPEAIYEVNDVYKTKIYKYRY